MNIKVQQPIPKPNCSSLQKREMVEAGVGRTGRKKPSVWDKENRIILKDITDAQDSQQITFHPSLRTSQQQQQL
ncbi:unnamed protein product [Didymodactylos carnosus]|uniref:Uncharacterized protein n=1 Tax=Didymodactylos carnosus TaxID=1234261 RepID=A0A814ZJE8_9BILA|nr:unnamed protein product [Didymodactylos carnosus]CAF4012196.1 unnamed protein product [Didymodactylos carnosus]